jgi:hypothetical protein
MKDNQMKQAEPLNEEIVFQCCLEAGMTTVEADNFAYKTGWRTLLKFINSRAKLTTSQVSEPTADYIAYLYRDNGKLKVLEEMPPHSDAFPVFTTNIRFLDVARLVLDDNVDLIVKHGGVPLWNELVKNINKLYADQPSAPTTPQEAISPAIAGYIKRLESAVSKARHLAYMDDTNIGTLTEIFNVADAAINSKPTGMD